MTDLLSKVQILKDPSSFLTELENLLVQRSVFEKCLLSHQQINLPVQELVLILDKLKYMNAEEVKNLLTKEPTQWTHGVKKETSFQADDRNSMTKDLAIEFYNNKRMELKLKGESMLDEFILVSEALSQLCKSYKHNLYQCVVACILFEFKEFPLVAVLPTGSGKTWIQGILALYHLQQDQKVTLIEPNIKLRDQTLNILG